MRRGIIQPENTREFFSLSEICCLKQRMFFNYVVIAAGIVAGIIVVVAGIVVVVVSLLCLWLSIVPLLLSKVFLSQYKCVRVFWPCSQKCILAYWGSLSPQVCQGTHTYIYIDIYVYLYFVVCFHLLVRLYRHQNGKQENEQQSCSIISWFYIRLYVNIYELY